MKTTEQLVDILKSRDVHIDMQAQLPKHVLMQIIMKDPKPKTTDSSASAPELQWAVLADPKQLQIEW